MILPNTPQVATWIAILTAVFIFGVILYVSFRAHGENKARIRKIRYALKFSISRTPLRPLPWHRKLVFVPIYSLLFSSVMGFAIYCLVFPSLSIWNALFSSPNILNAIVSGDFTQTLQESGPLGLYASSVVLGSLALWKAYQFFYPPPDRFFPRPDSGWAEEWTKVMDNLTPRLSRTVLDVINLSQSGVYLIVVTSLWVLAGHGIESVLLSWALLFVADDWGIIANYRRLLRGHMFKLDHARIHIFNGLLAVALGITLWGEREELPLSVISTLLVLLAICLLWRYVYEMQQASSSDIAEEAVPSASQL